jgi:hypothetical protein
VTLMLVSHSPTTARQSASLAQDACSTAGTLSMLNRH